MSRRRPGSARRFLLLASAAAVESARRQERRPRRAPDFPTAHAGSRGRRFQNRIVVPDGCRHREIAREEEMARESATQP